MIILDTNVLSEVMRPKPAPLVIEWLAGQPRSLVFTTTVTRGEIFYGLRLLPDGKRKQALWDAVHIIFNEDLAGQVLSFDEDAADAYADIAATRTRAGRPISHFDAMIAAIADSRGAQLATRNTKDFTDCGLDLINPWRT